MNATIIMVPMLLSIAFFTLMERKLMALTHFRLGPNKMGMLGIFQPFNDAIKLVTKENSKLSKTNHISLISSPVFILTMAMMVWISQPITSNSSKTTATMMTFITISSISIFFFITSGWSSFSKYSNLGAYRSTAQTISYEISLILILLPPIIIMKLMTTQNFQMMTSSLSLLIMMPLVIMWMITILAETNRTPFDLTEGESELVSGYNTEYSSGQFSMIFIAEYGMIIFMSVITMMMFFNLNNLVFMYSASILTMIFFIWSRVSFPRMRYDILMYMAWKAVMPFSIALFIMICAFL